MRVAPRIVLVGPMGSGKSTVGAALAERLGVAFHDLDACIERHVGMTIRQVFEQRGEPGFRSVERELACDLLRRSDPGVVAFGGGTFMDPVVRETVRSQRVRTVYLQVDAAEASTRLAMDPAVRPLLAEENPMLRWQELLRQREATYRAADAIVDASGGVDEVVTRVCEVLDA